MEFLDVVSKRYSCKKYDGRCIDKNQLDTILTAGKLAPTAKNLQEHHIYVVDSKEGLEKIDKVTPCRYNAGTVLIVTYDKNNVFTYPGDKRNSGVEDATIVATHMMLAATAIGVDNCWVNFFDPEQMAKEFNLPANEEVVMILDLGFANKEFMPLPNHEMRKELSETVTFI